MKKFIHIWLMVFTALVFDGCGLFSEHGTKLRFGASELYYKDGITAEEADKLGKYLLLQGFFDDENPKTAQITKRNDTYVFRMYTEDDYIKDASFERTIRFAAMDFSTDVFNGAKVDMELTDGRLETQKTINAPGTRMDQGTATIYRSYAVDAATAQKVTDYLVSIGFIGTKPLTIAYDIEGDDFIYEILTAEGAENNPDVVDANKAIAGLISSEVLNNKPIRMHFLADDYAIKASYPFEEIQMSYTNFINDSTE